MARHMSHAIDATRRTCLCECVWTASMHVLGATVVLFATVVHGAATRIVVCCSSIVCLITTTLTLSTGESGSLRSAVGLTAYVQCITAATRTLCELRQQQ
jgi:hypothetical protein